MNKYIRHILLPAIAPILIVGLYFTPVALFGCVNRGLMSLAVVLVSAIAALVTVGMAFRLRLKNDPSSGWWIISGLILTLPLVLILGPLG
ncbi:MAG: hypothetical protein MUF26_00510 [Syntrophales bacterium]|nr:hypothetical protein [Syntrophales bacterium]